MYYCLSLVLHYFGKFSRLFTKQTENNKFTNKSQCTVEKKCFADIDNYSKKQLHKLLEITFVLCLHWYISYTIAVHIEFSCYAVYQIPCFIF